MGNPPDKLSCPFAHPTAPPPAPPSLNSASLTSTTPGPTGLVSFNGPLDQLAFLADLVERFGDVVRYQTRFGPCFLFIHPNHVHAILHRENYRRSSLVKMMLGDGLLASDGPRWRSQRRLMQPDFQPARALSYATAIVDETKRTALAWKTAAANGDILDITSEMTQLTLRIVVKSLFSDDMSFEKTAAFCGAITNTVNDLGQIASTIFGAPAIITPESHAHFAKGKATVDATCYEMIARRRACLPQERPPDLLTLLIENNDGEATDLQLRDEVVTMLVGGNETTALGMAWVWKLLAENPHAEEQLHQELDTVLPGAPPTPDDLSRLPYTFAVFQEALRLYPPVWHKARVANEADIIDGHAIPRGASVLVSPWFTHRHKEFWPDPEVFNPMRFINAAPLHRYAYFPFGGGRHQCLGMHFANLEGVLLLANLAQQFRVKPIPGQSIQPDPGITLRQKPGMRATIHARSTCD